MQSRINAVGTVKFNKEESKLPWIRSGKTKGDRPLNYLSLNAALVNEHNRINFELFGMETKTVETYDSEGNKISIEWKDRLDEGVITNVRDKYIVSMNGERKEFITSWDVIEYIKQNKEYMSNKLFCFTGRIRKNEYEGNISDRFEIRNIYEAEEDAKPGFVLTEELFFSNDGIDAEDFAEDKKVYINGYTESYDSKSKSLKLFPRQLILDCSKIDFNNDKHVKLLGFKLKQIGLKLSNGKIVKSSDDKIRKIMCAVNYVNGAEEVAFDESCLTENQKEAIELGINTLEDFKPRGNIYGEKKVQYKIKDFLLNGEYSDGCVDAELTQEEFEEMLYLANVATETMESALKGSADEDDDDDEDLFA